MRGLSRADADPERLEPEGVEDLLAELSLSRLPVGRHGLSRSFIARNQRARIVAAMLRILPEHGYPATTIGQVAHEAGVSRGAFYEQFKSKEECFLATYDLAAGRLCESVERAVDAGEGEWPHRVKVGISEALRRLAANPRIAHLIAVEALQAGPAARERQQACLARFADALRDGRPECAELPSDLEELLLGGALSLVARYVDAGRVEQLSEVTAELVQYFLIPYLDPEETRRIAARAA